MRRRLCLLLALFFVVQGRLWAAETDVPLPAPSTEAQPPKKALERSSPNSEAERLMEMIDQPVFVPDWHTQTEWYTFKLLFGGMNGGLEMGTATLRWDHLIVAPLQVGVMGGEKYPASFLNIVFDFWAGPAIGAQYASNNFRDETRMLFGLYFGRMIESRDVEDGHGSLESTSGQCYGPFLSLDLAWVRHLSKRFASHLGMKMMIATYKLGDVYPRPSFWVYWGFSI